MMKSLSFLPNFLTACSRSLVLAGMFSAIVNVAACSAPEESDAAAAGATGATTASQAAANGLGGTMSPGAPVQPSTPQNPDIPTTTKDASRLLQQASFGANEASINAIALKGPRKWLLEQFSMPPSTYGAITRDAIHKWVDKTIGFCDSKTGAERNSCWRDWYSSEPLRWDFFRQATLASDQLRQRVAFALGQILVISGRDLEGTYGMADYHQTLRDRAFDNYRDLLRAVTLHPAMGQYLNMVDNDAVDPNENYARELLQLFSIGTCQLNADGSLVGGSCKATYDINTVREYAFALTGWTYPVGGLSPWCTPNSKCGWRNPIFLRGPMVAVAAKHDNQPRSLLSGIALAAGRTPEGALESVLDSLMGHPNIGPFIGKQLIQHLVTGSPSPAYVARVAGAFNSGAYAGIGSGRKGDLKATIAAILLDAEARDPSSADSDSFGRLKDPVFVLTASIRALNGQSDGEPLGRWGVGGEMDQAVFDPPSVFSFYAADGTLPGRADLSAPGFGIANANSHLARINWANTLLFWWYNKGAGLAPAASLPANIGIGTKVLYDSFETQAATPAQLVDRLDLILTGGRLGNAEKTAIVRAMNSYTSADTWLTGPNSLSSWQRERVKVAAYLILSSPHFQIQR